MKEIDMEDIIVKYPELIEEGLKLIGRQVTVFGRRMDLYFSDSNNRKLIVELKAVPILDKHIGQIMSYEGSTLSEKEPDIRVMLVGTRVPPNLQKALDHHGIAWREIKFSDIRQFLESKKDNSFNYLFENDNLLSQHDEKEKSELDYVDISEFPALVETIINKAIKPISNNITVKIGKRYSSYFLNGGRFLHFYDRSQTRIQLHIEKRYLNNQRKVFNMDKLKEFFEVNETKEDYPIKIRNDEHLAFLSNFLYELYQ